MVFKGIGGGMLLMCAFVYCYQCERRTAQIQRIIGAWISLLTYIKTQISCFGTPVSDILLHADREMISLLESDGVALTATALSEGSCIHAALPKDCKILLEHLGQELGTVWRQEQVERLTYYVAALTEQREAFGKANGGSVRIRRALSLCGALGLILLVW